MNKIEAYQTLGLKINATEDDIKAAYLKLVKQYHPDVCKDPQSEALTKKINETYTILTRPQPAQPQMFDIFRNNPFGGMEWGFVSATRHVAKTTLTLELENASQVNIIIAILAKNGIKIKSYTTEQRM